MRDKKLEGLENFAKENDDNNQLKDIYLRKVLNNNKEYE